MTEQPINGGMECPDTEIQNCPIPCQYTWDVWSACNKATGTVTRDPIVTAQRLNGGAACPTTETGPCDVSCEYTWGLWLPSGVCTSNVTQTQSPVVTVQPIDTGDPCPPDNTRLCTPCKNKNKKFFIFFEFYYLNSLF